jgi:hypothetical protein
MELKVLCNCGQKYKFDVEPVSNRMPFAVNCPVCGADGTPLANSQLSQMPIAAAPAIPVAAIVPMAAAPALAVPAAIPPQRPGVRIPTMPATPRFSLGMGILGAFIGATVAAGLMYGFYLWAGFRFPLLGVGIGALTGILARVMAKGTGNELGVFSAILALAATTGTLWLIYGELPIISLISVAVSASVAYRTASS